MPSEETGPSVDDTARGFPDAGDVRGDPETLEKWCQECGRTLPSSRGFSWCPYCADGQPPTPNPCYRAVHTAMDRSVPTPAEDEMKGTLERVADEGRAQCRFCDHWVEGDSFGEIFEKLAEHGEDAHDWDDSAGWSA